MRFKICCITSVAEAEMAIEAGAWAIGLVAQMPSGPGPISDDKICEITKATKGRVKQFLLTSQTEPDAVIEHVQVCGTDVVQLVDAVPVATYAALRRFCPDVAIVQVIHVQNGKALDEAKAAARHCDMILLDSGRPDGAVKELGGTGRIHDWVVSTKIVRELEVPVILAGGLNPQNASPACEAVSPYALDVCSGLRGHGFALDAEKLNYFSRACRRTNV